MIVYNPLLKTLEKKKVSIFELQEKIKYPSLKQTMNAGRYLSTKVVDHICSVLDCKVQDVIAYQQGDQVQKERENKLYTTVDWKKMKQFAEENDMHLPQLSISLGYSRSYLNTCCRSERIGRRQFLTVLSKINFVYNTEFTLDDFIPEPVGPADAGDEL